MKIQRITFFFSILICTINANSTLIHTKVDDTKETSHKVVAPIEQKHTTTADHHASTDHPTDTPSHTNIDLSASSNVGKKIPTTTEPAHIVLLTQQELDNIKKRNHEQYTAAKTKEKREYHNHIARKMKKTAPISDKKPFVSVPRQAKKDNSILASKVTDDMEKP